MNQERDLLLLQNQNLIYSALKYFPYYPNKEDLVQVGRIGMMKAYDNYDPSKGAKFQTYAYSYILGEMKKWIREDKGVKVSREITTLHLKVEKAYLLLTQRLMREPSIEEISHYLEVPEANVVEAMSSVHSVESMDKTVASDSRDLTLHDTVAEERKVELDTLIMLRDAIMNLGEEEQNLIKTRYYQDMTQTETAQILGMSQVQVCRKEQKVLQKLKGELVS